MNPQTSPKARLLGVPPPHQVFEHIFEGFLQFCFFTFSPFPTLKDSKLPKNLSSWLIKIFPRPLYVWSISLPQKLGKNRE